MSWQPPEQIKLQRSFPGWAIAFLVIGSVCAALGFVDRDYFFVAFPFVLLALALWLNSRKALTLRFDPDGIADISSGKRIAYRDITHLRLTEQVLFDQGSVDRRPEMIIGHRHGVIVLPRGFQLPRMEFYNYLLEKSTLLAPPSTFPGRLKEAYEQEVQDFGPAQVLASIGRDLDPLEAPGGRKLFTLSTVFIVSAFIAWVGNANRELVTVYTVVASFMLLLGLLFLPLFSRHRKLIRKLRAESGIIISPRGLTLESPSLKGVLRWSEVRGMILVNRMNTLVRGLLLKIEGSQFLIGDHYACPLNEIWRRIDENVAHEKQ